MRVFFVASLTFGMLAIFFFCVSNTFPVEGEEETGDLNPAEEFERKKKPDPAKPNCTTSILESNCLNKKCGEKCDNERPFEEANDRCKLENGTPSRYSRCCRCPPTGITIINFTDKIYECSTSDPNNCWKTNTTATRADDGKPLE